MENRRKNSRKNIAMADVDTLVLKDHLLRKIEDVMDYAAVAVQKSSNRHRFPQSRPHGIVSICWDIKEDAHLR